MNERDHDQLDARQRLAREAVRSLGTPAADPAFRARLKARFVAEAAPRAPELPPARRFRPLLPAAAALAAAALLAVAVLGLNRLPGPRLLAASGGSVVVDGRAVDAADTDALASLLRPGAHLEVGDGAVLDLVYPGTMVWRVSGGSDLVLPARPGRWFGRDVAATLALGEVSVRTGPDLAGGALAIATPESRAVITGTLVNVFRNAELTCICLLEGHARAEAGGRDLGPIPVMKRWVVFADGRAPELLDIAPPHLRDMQELDADHGDVFGPPSE